MNDNLKPFTHRLKNNGYRFGFELDGKKQTICSVVDGVLVLPLQILPGYVLRDSTGAPLVLDADAKRIRREIRELEIIYKEAKRGRRRIEQLDFMAMGVWG